MVRIHQTSVPMWKQQIDAILSQVNPVSGTKYTVLDTVKNARIIAVMAHVTWTVQPSPLQVHVTIDDLVDDGAFIDPVSALGYRLYIDQNGVFSLISGLNYQAFLLEGKSIKIEAETTGGTTSSLDARVRYALRR